MGRLAFEEVQARLNSDLFLSSLPESGMSYAFCDALSPMFQ